MKLAYQFLLDHEAFVSLFVLAAVVTMRERLPAPFNKIDLLNWGYSWLHDTLKTFVSFRSPQPATLQKPEPTPQPWPTQEVNK